MEPKRKRLTLDMDPSLQRRLKAVSALKGVSMRSYCSAAIDNALKQDEANGLDALGFNDSDAERFARLREKIYGGRVLTGDGAEFIRAARESRDCQLENEL